MRARIVALVVAAAAGGVSYAAAATLGVASNLLGSGQTTVPACDTDGFSYTHTLDSGHHVLTVTVSGIDAACASGTLQLTLADSSNASVGSGSASVPAGGSATVSISGAPLASSVASYRSAITS